MPNAYKEQLPDQCPPAEAREVAAEMIVFRLISTAQVTQADFMSQRAMRPEANFRAEECIARGLSVWVTHAAAANAQKLPRLRQTIVCRVRLCPGAGKLMQTFKPDHRTWWPFAAYLILNHCEVLA
jgi:hypothetical protein